MAADKECERVVSNWIQHKSKWKRSDNEKEPNLRNVEKTCMLKHLWSANMMMILYYVNHD